MSDPSSVQIHRVRLKPDGTAGPVELQTGQYHRIVVCRDRVHRPRTEYLRFAHDSAILAPLDGGSNPALAIATALLHLHRSGDGRLLVLGHASAVGNSSHNDALARDRAAGVAAWIRGRADAWVDLVTRAGTPADVQRWLLHLANAHDWPTDPGRVDGVLDAAAEHAVRQFQHTFNQQYDDAIEVHGKITRQTLGALFRVLAHDLSSQLRAGGVEDTEALTGRLGDDHVVGCGSEFAGSPRFEEADEPAGARRVDLLSLPADALWQPQMGVRSLIATCRLELLDYDPHAMTPRELTIRLVDHYGRPVAGETYVLQVGSEQRRGTTDGDGVLVEHDVRGQHVALSLEEGPSIVFDEAFAQVVSQRYRPPAAPEQDADDDEPYDDPLPALIEDDDQDEDWDLPDLERELDEVDDD